MNQQMTGNQQKAQETFFSSLNRQPATKSKAIPNNSQVQRLVANITVEIKCDGNFKFSPSWLRQLKRRRLHDPCGIIETRMQLKNSTLYNNPKVLICCSTNIYSPFMRLIPCIRKTWSLSYFLFVEEKEKKTILVTLRLKQYIKPAI